MAAVNVYPALSVDTASQQPHHQHLHHRQLTADNQWSGMASINDSSSSCQSPTSSPNSSLTSSNSSFAVENLNSISAQYSASNGQLDEPKRSFSACALSLTDSEFMMGFLERKPFRPFRSNEEYLIAMKEDLAEWLNTLYSGLDLTVDTFLSRLETGITLCRHANSVLNKAREWRMLNGYSPFKHLALSDFDLDRDVPVNHRALPGTFQARDNVANFIQWCRRIRIHECLLFETEDLVARKNEKSFVICLLEVARYGAKFGLLAPTLVQFEQEIDKELENDQKHANSTQSCQSLPNSPNKGVSTSQTSPSHHLSLESADSTLFEPKQPQQQITNNDLESLHEKVVNLLSRCTCPIQFYLEHLSEGKYRIGDTKTLIFVRILRNHVMVRVGGGWDTLEHYLEKHDPCRCRFGHKYSSAAKVSLAQNNIAPKVTGTQMQVTYERPESTVAQSRRLFSINSSPTSTRKLIRPNSVTNNLSSINDLAGVRRASTSSNDSVSSISSGSLPMSNSSDKCCDSILSSEHSSLSSSHSLNHFNSVVIPDRNNNIKGLNKMIPQPKPSPAMKRVLPSIDCGISRIPMSKSSNSPAVPIKAQNSPQHGFRTLTNANKLKSTSTLAIPQLSSASSMMSLSSKIPSIVDSKYKPRNGRMADGSLSRPNNMQSRYSSHNIFLDVSQTPEKDKSPKRPSLQNGTFTPTKQRPRVTNLNRAKQKSSLDLNSRNNNFYTNSQQESKPEPVPNLTKPQKVPYQQHRRHHSSSSLPRTTKSAHNSPYSKRREFQPSSACHDIDSPNVISDRNMVRPNKTGFKLDPKKRFQGSATSLNSTASTGSRSSSSSSGCFNSSLSSTTVTNSQENVKLSDSESLTTTAVPAAAATTAPDSRVAAALIEPNPTAKKFINSEKKVTPSALVEVCSWLERNHMAST